MATKRSAFEAAKWVRAAEMAGQAADAMADEESAAVTAAALRDPDCPPRTREQVARMRPMPFVRELRLRLGLSQQAFADRYGILVANIRAWEIGDQKPVTAMVSLLEMIDADPDGLARAHAEAERRGHDVHLGRHQLLAIAPLPDRPR